MYDTVYDPEAFSKCLASRRYLKLVVNREGTAACCSNRYTTTKEPPLCFSLLFFASTSLHMFVEATGTKKGQDLQSGKMHQLMLYTFFQAHQKLKKIYVHEPGPVLQKSGGSSSAAFTSEELLRSTRPPPRGTFFTPCTKRLLLALRTQVPPPTPHLQLARTRESRQTDRQTDGISPSLLVTTVITCKKLLPKEVSIPWVN